MEQFEENQGQRFIKFEVTRDTVITEEYKNTPLAWLMDGNRRFKGFLVPVTDEQYKAYMRPEWVLQKRQQRMAESRKKREKAMAKGREDKTIMTWDTPVSYEELCETEYGFGASDELDGAIDRRTLKATVRELMLDLESIDRKIMTLFMEGYSEAEIGKKVGLSQKAVNKRKHKVLEGFRFTMKDFL